MLLSVKKDCLQLSRNKSWAKAKINLICQQTAVTVETYPTGNGCMFIERNSSSERRRSARQYKR